MATSRSHILQKYLYGGVLVLLLLLSPMHITRAQGFPVIDFQNTFTNTLQTISQIALEQKELVWDGLFFSIAKEALQQECVEWIIVEFAHTFYVFTHGIDRIKEIEM